MHPGTGKIPPVIDPRVSTMMSESRLRCWSKAWRAAPRENAANA
jgi:hypothetical protein